MLMDTTGIDSQAVTLRPERYKTLFMGELPYETLPPEAQVGIAGLSRQTELSGNRTPEAIHHIGNIPGIVDEILTEHDNTANADGEALFAFVDNETEAVVSGIVTDVISKWELASSRRKLDKLVPHEHHSAKWLVVETAAAVMSAAGPENGFKIKKHKHDRDMLTKIIAGWGPEFARQWFDGTIINQWMDIEGIKKEDQKDWLNTFTPGMRKRFAGHNFHDPLGALKRAKTNLETILTDSNIANELGWSEAEVAEIVTPSMRKHFATNNVANPLEALKRVKISLDTILTDENIANELGWSEKEVVKLFSPADRRRFAVSNISNPLAALKRANHNLHTVLTDENIAKELGWSEAEVAEIVPPGMRKQLAVHNITDPLEGLKHVKDNLETLLTDENIAKELGWSEAEVAEIVPPGMRRHLALNYSTDPIEALRRVKTALETILTDDSIAEHLGWTVDEVKKVFSPGARKYFAMGHLSDPLGGLDAWIHDRTSIYSKTDEAMRAKLRAMGKK